jgi:DNA-binding IclR family transcriptional regulator
VLTKPTLVRPRRRRRPKDEASQRSGAVPGEQYQLKAISRALEVLDGFDDDQTSLSLKEIARLIKLPESSLFRILLTLKAQGYLIQNEDGSYRLADKLLYGRVHERAEQIRKALRPHLQSLARRFDETASLAYLYGEQIRVLDALETFQEIRMINRPGRVLPPHCSSLGKAITAFQEPALIERMLEVYGLIRRTEKTIVDRRALFEEYATIRQRGYAFDRQETVLGGLCIGAPITLKDNHVIVAISVSTPLVRMTSEREAEVIEGVVETARKAAHDLH